MSIAAGALAVLAFTAFSGAASAAESPLKCEGAGACTYSISGGESKLSLTGGDTVKCTSTTGSGEMTNLDANRESTTGLIEFHFSNCREQNSGFQFSCTNTATAGTTTTNWMVFHAIRIPFFGWLLLITGWNETFTCAGGFASTQVTGNVIGQIETACGTTGTTLALNFTSSSHGVQTLTTYTGSTFKLEGKTSHTGGGSYAQAAQTGTSTLTFNQNVVPTC
ncbi:MAG TPA: hypothetical protein VHP56_11875 [Solirubrobacterales bacterium]|jgi:hypothetical protein|nr:hypothetical protein [Solirubrobacterales bacterium]